MVIYVFYSTFHEDQNWFVYNAISRQRGTTTINVTVNLSSTHGMNKNEKVVVILFLVK